MTKISDYANADFGGYQEPESVVSDWYEHLKAALDILRSQKDTREKAIVITMLEQVIAYAWLWIIKK